MPTAITKQVTIVAAVFVVACALWLGAMAVRHARAGNEFDFVQWELVSLPNKWLFALGAPLRDDPGAEEAIARYFALEDRESVEARRLENVVEAAIEGRIDAVLADLGLGWPLPGPLPVMPPVDIELAGPPRILVVSPRETIERERTDTLRPDLTVQEAQAIEQRVEEGEPTVSSLVVASGGIATYPAIVTAGSDYENTVSTAAHEWIHHYLSLYPLGRAYFGSDEARTINETVADLIGYEVGQLVLARWPGPADADEPPPAAAAAPAVDRDEVLRALRMEVDSLLANGDIEAAERLMEDVRKELEEAGVRIRRINQAYFAWYGTYAARPDSVDPLGGQLRDLRERAGSLPRFVELIRGVTTRADVADVLSELGRPP